MDTRPCIIRTRLQVRSPFARMNRETQRVEAPLRCLEMPTLKMMRRLRSCQVNRIGDKMRTSKTRKKTRGEGCAEKTAAQRKRQGKGEGQEEPLLFPRAPNGSLCHRERGSCLALRWFVALVSEIPPLRPLRKIRSDPVSLAGGMIGRRSLATQWAWQRKLTDMVIED